MNQDDVVFCQGENAQTGHPGVFLDLSKNGEALCPYCSKKFTKHLRNEGYDERSAP